MEPGSHGGSAGSRGYAKRPRLTGQGSGVFGRSVLVRLSMSAHSARPFSQTTDLFHDQIVGACENARNLSHARRRLALCLRMAWRAESNPTTPQAMPPAVALGWSSFWPIDRSRTAAALSLDSQQPAQRWLDRSLPGRARMFPVLGPRVPCVVEARCTREA